VDPTSPLSPDDLLVREMFGYRAIHRTKDFYPTSWGYGASQKLHDYEAKGFIRRWQSPTAPSSNPDDVAWVLTHRGILWLVRPAKRVVRNAHGESTRVERTEGDDAWEPNVCESIEGGS
jgi:hypothetical protein